MKKRIIVFCFTFFILMAGWASHKIKSSGESDFTPNSEPEGTAVIITGAAARIPQEAALLEKLYNSGELKDVVFISGASSGALNTVMLNGILSKKITWKQYISWLNEINNDSIFKREDKKLPVDTNPLRNYLTRVICDSLNYHKIGDLDITSAISITDLNRLDLPKKNYRLCSKPINPESDPNLNIIEVLMASTAFPVVFPPERISNAPTLPDHSFVDGGLQDDHVPYTALLEFIKFRGRSVKKVIIVSRKSDRKPELSEELHSVGFTDRGILDRLGISLDEILYKGFIKGLNSYKKDTPYLVDKTFVFIPDFTQNFLLLNFNDLEIQYKVTKNWANNHSPVPLNLYLKNAEKAR